MSDKVGKQIGNYRLIRLLGSGGFADVYLGQHIHVQRLQAAIKILHANLPGVYQGEFFQEAENIAGLKHPHIIRILEFGIDRDNAPYLIMEYASQGTLRTRHPKGSIVPHGTIVSYVKPIAEALQYAHDHNLIHRDLKPENLLVGENGEIVLSDFGIASVVHGTASLETGIYAGTLPYSAPEQILGKPRRESDQYSLGIIVYEWLCGERPFTGTMQEIIYQQLGVPPVPLHEKVTNILPEVAAVVMKALAKEPKDRFASIQTFAQTFEQACILERQAEEERLQAEEKERARQAEEERLRQAEEKRARRAEEERCRLAEEAEQTRRMEEEKQRRIKEERARQAEEERLRKAREEEQASQVKQPEPEPEPAPVDPVSETTDTNQSQQPTEMATTVPVIPSPQQPVSDVSAAIPAQSQTILPLSGRERLPQPAYPGISRRTVIVSLAGLAVASVAGGGLLWLTHSQQPAAPPASSTPTSTPTSHSVETTLYTYRGHSAPVNAVAWSPDGKRIASGGFDNLVQVWQPV